MNKFDVGSIKTPLGFIGFYRQVHRSSNFILRDGKRDIIFATKEEAEKAALEAFLEYLNTPIVAESMTGPTNKKALARTQLDKLFRGGGKTVAVERIGGRA